MKRGVDFYMRLMEYVSFACVILVEWIIIPVPIVVRVYPLYARLDDVIAARKAGKLRYENCRTFNSYAYPGGIQNSVLLGVADHFQFFFGVAKKVFIVMYPARQPIEAGGQDNIGGRCDHCANTASLVFRFDRRRHRYTEKIFVPAVYTLWHTDLSTLRFEPRRG